MLEKINKDNLIVLKLGLDNTHLEIDFLPIEKKYENELSEFKSALLSTSSNKVVLIKFKFFHFLLDYYNYCVNVADSYRELRDYSSREGLRDLLSTTKERLEKFFSTRLEAYRIKETYLKANILLQKSEILAFSHRKRGWTAAPFKLNGNFQIQFETNFGYGYVSRFYLTVKYKNILIIPYSDWIIYHNASIIEIRRYTRRYNLKDESWREAMEDCRNLYNQSIDDEAKFVEQYIMQEARKMVEGLKGILKYNQFKLLNLNKDEVIIKKEGWQILEYRAEKVAGALQFVGDLLEYYQIKGIPEIIKEIEAINKELLPILRSEVEIITKRLNEIEPELIRLKPIVEKLEKRYYQGEQNEYLNTHNDKYNPLVQEVKKLKPTKEAIAKYLNEIEQYFKLSN